SHTIRSTDPMRIWTSVSIDCSSMAKQAVMAALPYPGPAPEESIPACGHVKSGAGDANAFPEIWMLGMARSEPF
ncbi:MAG TPA: hypothetical protein VH642_10505, partial [Streptosporangiaceae bacterium]